MSGYGSFSIISLSTVASSISLRCIEATSGLFDDRGLQACPIQCLSSMTLSLRGVRKL